VFSHTNALGVAPAEKLFELINVTLTDTEKPARHYTDYTRTIDRAQLPEGVDLEAITDRWPTPQP
jgi:CRISPR-associated protein Csd2